MEKNLEILKSVALFHGIGEEDLSALLACLGAKAVRYEKGRTVLHHGDEAGHFGIVLEGLVQIVADDYYGNRSILSAVGAGGLFAESFAFAGLKALPVSVIAAVDCHLLFIEGSRVASPCSNACGFHRSLVRNMLGIVSMKNIQLTRKNEILSRRSTREKLMAYLSAQAETAGSGRFTIPFDRQGLADYLSVDRSAMSAELSKLKSEGVLDYHKNQFELL